MIYKLLTTNGQIHELKRDTILTLKEQQDLVGGDIEYISLHNLTLCINAEGLVIGLPNNPYFPDIKGNVIIGQFVSGEEGLDFVGL